MNVLMILRISLRALVRNKLRTLLTMLGIIIGVATVITMLAIGTGARSSVEASIASLGTNTLTLMPGSANQGGVRSGAFGRTNLTPEDLAAIARECPSVLATSPLTQNGSQVVYQNQNWQTSVNGGGVDFVTIRNWPMASGRFFLDDEVRAAAKVAVIGKVVADNLFGNEDPIDKVIRVKNVPMRVVGVLSEKGDSAYGYSQDDLVVVPYTTAMKRLFHLNYLRSGMISARSKETVEKARSEITGLLRQRHRLQPGDDDDFTIRTQLEFAETADASARVFTLLLGGIASVSLLVGGIGIMNIMLVSVTERIREIGIRMALGARGSDIMLQFLVESMLLSLIGGIIGIMLGYGLAHVAARFSEWPLVISSESVLMSFGFSAVVGVFFGFYPAVKASQLDPIQALRHE